MCAASRAGSESCFCRTGRKPTPRLRHGFASAAFSTRRPRSSTTRLRSPAESKSQQCGREDPMPSRNSSSRARMLSIWAVLILSALASAPPALGQDRMPPVPPDKYDEAEKKAEQEFQSARKGPVFGPFSVLIRSPELMTANRMMGDYLRLKPSIGTQLFRAYYSCRRARMDAGL